VNIFFTKKIKGAILLDSLIALTLLASVLTSWVIFNQINHERKTAKKLAAETITYARTYAKYMNDNSTMLVNQAKLNGTVVLSPASIGNKWNTDLATTNLLRQTPCVSIVMNQKTGYLEAIMYYVGGNNTLSHKEALITREALVVLGSSGGLFLHGIIRGSAGWLIDATSDFLAHSEECGHGNVANNSLTVNLDLLPEWNRDTMPSTAIAKEMDGSKVDDGVRKMPGHLLNANTIKSDITLLSGNGIILDNSDSMNPVKLKMGYAEGTNAATIGLYSNSSTSKTKVLVDTLDPVQTGTAGESCMLQEVGKIIVDRGNGVTKEYLNRSTLTCSQNSMMCSNINPSHTCYLPTEANRIVFMNQTYGIQNNSGNFVCPKEVPFASDIVSSKGGDTGTMRLDGNLSGYTVTIGYYVTVPETLITQVTCSNMPDYEISARTW
jgi:hypothetical protein